MNAAYVYKMPELTLKRHRELVEAITRLTEERDDALAEVEETRKSVEPSFDAGFHLGALQMREKAAQLMDSMADASFAEQKFAGRIRALPLKEESK